MGMFSDGFGTRDPMTIKVGQAFYTYYSPQSGHGGLTPMMHRQRDLVQPLQHGGEMRTLVENLAGDLDALEALPKLLPQGGEAGIGALFGRMSPFRSVTTGSPAIIISFRTQHYGKNAETRVYRSKDPANFGRQ